MSVCSPYVTWGKKKGGGGRAEIIPFFKTWQWKSRNGYDSPLLYRSPVTGTLVWPMGHWGYMLALLSVNGFQPTFSAFMKNVLTIYSLLWGWSTPYFWSFTGKKCALSVYKLQVLYGWGWSWGLKAWTMPMFQRPILSTCMTFVDAGPKPNPDS